MATDLELGAGAARGGIDPPPADGRASPPLGQKQWPVWVVALASLALAGAQWLSGDRIGVERRVATLEGQSTLTQESLKRIQDDVRDIRKFLMGDRQ